MIEDILAQFQTRPPSEVYLIRYRRGTYRNGVFTSTPLFRRRFSGSVQPLGGEDIRVTPEGVTDNKVAIKIITTEKLYVNDQKSGQKADDLEIEGTVYQVDVVVPLPFLDIGHYEVIAIKDVK